MTVRTLVDAYISELTAAARVLPAQRRAELIADVQEHIEAALGTAGAGDEAAVRNVLERLGSPDEIVAAERDEGQPPLPPARSLTPTRIVIAVLAGLLVLLLAVLSGTSGLPAAVMAIAFAVVTPYVWVPLVLALFAPPGANRNQSRLAPHPPVGLGRTRAACRRLCSALARSSSSCWSHCSRTAFSTWALSRPSWCRSWCSCSLSRSSGAGAGRWSVRGRATRASFGLRQETASTSNCAR